MMIKFCNTSTNNSTDNKISAESRSMANTLGAKARAIEYSLLGMLLVGIMLAGNVFAESDGSNELRDINVASMPGDRIQIILTLANEAEKQPISFTIDNPARIALDLKNTHNRLAKRSQSIGVGVARSITAVEAKGRTRVILNLAQMVPYETKVKGNQVIITLDRGAAITAAVASESTGSAAQQSTQQQSITQVDFRRGEKGEGRVIVFLSNPSTAVDMREEGGNIIVDFLSVNLPQNLERRLDVIDFATPVKMIDTLSQGNNVHMVITPLDKEFEHLAYQSDNIYTIEFKPVSKAQQEIQKKKKFGYSGEKLSLNFQNIEVRAVLQLLADFTGLNVVVSDTVSGSLTLRLKSVPWDQALDIILKTKGLAMRKKGNVMLVGPSEEIAAREKLELESQKQIEELAPLRTEWFQINYANATDLFNLFSSTGEGSASLLSERGSAVVDERTNTLMIQDTRIKLNEIRQLITRLDIPVRQVLIESRIVIANDDFAKDLGVKFGLSRSTVYNSGSSSGIAVVGGTVDGFLVPAAGVTGFESPAGSGQDGLIVDFGAIPAKGTAAQIAFAVGNIGSHLLELELSALQAEGGGEIISSPRVITANQKKAVIKQGVEIPYQQASSSGATAVTFKEAVLSLEVTPQITPDDRVIMDLRVSKDSPDFTRSVNGVPPLDTREIETQVLVNNGDTVVLGGIYEQTKSRRSNQVPFFADLPLLGFMFKDKSTTDNKQELLIFVTPKIIKDGMNEGL